MLVILPYSVIFASGLFRKLASMANCCRYQAVFRSGHPPSPGAALLASTWSFFVCLWDLGLGRFDLEDASSSLSRCVACTC